MMTDLGEIMFVVHDTKHHVHTMVNALSEISEAVTTLNGELPEISDKLTEVNYMLLSLIKIFKVMFTWFL